MNCPICLKPLVEVVQNIEMVSARYPGGRRWTVTRKHNVCKRCNVRVVLHVHDRSIKIGAKIKKDMGL